MIPAGGDDLGSTVAIEVGHDWRAEEATRLAVDAGLAGEGRRVGVPVHDVAGRTVDPYDGAVHRSDDDVPLSVTAHIRQGRRGEDCGIRDVG